MPYLLNLDYNLFLVLNKSFHPPVLLFLAKLFSGAETLGFIWFIIALTLIYFERNHPRILVELFLALFASFCFVNLIFKPLIGRLRPEFILENINVFINNFDYFSFPSGHAASSFAGALILSNIFPKGKIFFYLLALLISLSRVYLGVHFFSDIIAGAILGLVVAQIIVKWSLVKIKKNN